MEEQKTTAHQHGCFLCTTALPLLREVVSVSEETQEHFRTSRVEFLKGIRSLIDDRIAKLSREEPKGTKLVVE